MADLLQLRKQLERDRIVLQLNAFEEVFSLFSIHFDMR
jgi:hypothetical protein